MYDIRLNSAFCFVLKGLSSALSTRAKPMHVLALLILLISGAHFQFISIFHVKEGSSEARARRTL